MTKKAPLTFTFTLMMAKTENSAPVEIVSSPFEADVMRTANHIAKGLAVAQYRGCVLFTIMKNSVPEWAATLSFTDDLPEGIWNVTQG